MLSLGLKIKRCTLFRLFDYSCPNQRLTVYVRLDSELKGSGATGQTQLRPNGGSQEGQVWDDRLSNFRPQVEVYIFGIETL